MSVGGAMLEALVRVLDESHAFQSLADSLLELSHLGDELTRSPQSAVVAVSVNVDVLHVLEFCAELAYLVVNFPAEVYELLRCVLSQCCHALRPRGCLFSLHHSQILLRLVVYNMPCDSAIPSLRPAAHCDRFHCHPLISCSGVLISLSLPLQFVECCRHVCSSVECGEDFVSVFFPGRIQPAAITGCHRCGCALKEDVSVRRVSDVIIARLTSLCAFEDDILKESSCHNASTLAVSCRLQSLVILLRGSLCGQVQLGGRYQVVGCRVLSPSGLVTLDALSFKPLPLDIFVQPLSFAISPVIERLYQDSQQSPWRFVFSLAFSFCRHITPAGTYFHLKLGLLLSLVACGSLRYSRRLPVLAIGDDTWLLRRLLTHASCVAQRHVQHTCHNQLTGIASSGVGGDLTSWVTTSGHAARSSQTAVTLEAGSLLLARGGVCCLADMSAWPSREVQRLQKVMETGLVDIKHSGSCRTRGDATHARTHTVPLLAQVWGVYNRRAISTDTVSAGVGDIGVGLCDGVEQHTGAGARRRLTRTLLESFGMVFVVDSRENNTASDDLTYDPTSDPTCDLTSDPTSDLTRRLMTSRLLHSVCITEDYHFTLPSAEISMDEFKSFVSAAGERSLEVDPSAEHLVRRYYVSSRLARCSDHPDVPVAAVSTISNMAHSFAQLSLSHHVDVDHVTAAIFLYEQALAACFGQSPLEVASVAHVRSAEAIGSQNDEAMREFQQRLLQFVNHWADS